MNFFARLFILSILFFSIFSFLYCLIPLFSFIFFGSFRIVSQCPGYLVIFSFICLPSLGVLFHELFNSDLTIKNNNKK